MPPLNTNLLHCLCDIFHITGITEKLVYCSTPEDSEAMRRNEGRYPQRQQTGFLTKARKKLDMHGGILEVKGEEWHRVNLFSPVGIE